MRLRTRNTSSDSPVKAVPSTRSTRRRGQQKENSPITAHKQTKPTKLQKALPARKAPARSGRKVKCPELNENPQSEVEVEDVLAPLDADESFVAVQHSPLEQPLPNSQSTLPPSSDIPNSIPSSEHDQAIEDSQPSHTPSSPWSGPKFEAANSEIGEYADEPSRHPDPADPFGFLAAERQIQLRREALRQQGGDLSFEEEMAVAAELDWERGDSEDNEDEDAPRAFATPKRARVSKLRRSTRHSTLSSSQQSLVNDPPAKLKAAPKQSSSPNLTPLELVDLLPKRRPAKKFPKLGQRTGANTERKTARTKASRSIRGSENDAPRTRPRRVVKKERVESDDDREEIELDVNEKKIKARETRKRAFGELDNYRLETETEIWL